MTTTQPTSATVKVHYTFTEYVDYQRKERSRTVRATIPTWPQDAPVTLAPLDWRHDIYILPDGTLCTGTGRHTLTDGKIELGPLDQTQAADTIDRLVLAGDTVYHTCDHARVLLTMNGLLANGVRIGDEHTGVDLSLNGIEAPLTALPLLRQASALMTRNGKPDGITGPVNLAPLGPAPDLDPQAIAAYLNASRNLRDAARNAGYGMSTDNLDALRTAIDALDDATSPVAHLL